MFTIAFAQRNAATAYFSMAEGMEEVQRDNQNTKDADRLDFLTTLGWQAVAKIPKDATSFEVFVRDDDLKEIVERVLENCRDNASGMTRDDPEAEYYVFEGDVTIGPADIDWTDPAARLRLIERIGVDAYNAKAAAYQQAMIVATIGGYDIRLIHTARFGELFEVTRTSQAFSTLEQAIAYAHELGKLGKDPEQGETV